MLCLVLPALLCASLYAALRPAGLSLLVAGGMAALYAWLVAALRAAFLEHEYKVRCIGPIALAHALRTIAINQVRLFITQSSSRATEVVMSPPSLSMRPNTLCLLAQACQVPEAELADSDSRFRSVNGINVHYKAANYASQTGAAGVPAIAMYHGFGANTFSWSFVHQKLARRMNAVVVSHDMPGFGLTQRCRLI